jgi:hypothetical protein
VGAPASTRLSRAAQFVRGCAGDQAQRQALRGRHAASLSHASADRRLSLVAHRHSARSGKPSALCRTAQTRPFPWPCIAHGRRPDAGRCLRDVENAYTVRSGTACTANGGVTPSKSSLCSRRTVLPSSRSSNRLSTARKRRPGGRLRHRRSRREASLTKRARCYHRSNGTLCRRSQTQGLPPQLALEYWWGVPPKSTFQNISARDLMAIDFGLTWERARGDRTHTSLSRTWLPIIRDRRACANVRSDVA